MKSIKVLIAVAIAALSLNANAQLVKKTDGYDRAQASFVIHNISVDYATDYEYANYRDIDAKGVEIGYIKGINLTNRRPLFLELGGELTFSHAKKEHHETYDLGFYTITEKSEYKSTFLSIGIPVDAAYKFSFSSNDISVTPFFGFNFKVNLLGKEKDKEYEYAEDKEVEYKYSYFDSDAEEVGDDTANRFQFGLNLGVGVDLGNFYVGYRFQPDLIKYWKNDNFEMKSHTSLVTVGLYF